MIKQSTLSEAVETMDGSPVMTSSVSNVARLFKPRVIPPSTTSITESIAAASASIARMTFVVVWTSKSNPSSLAARRFRDGGINVMMKLDGGYAELEG